jgi:hypothetical protein
MHGLGLSEPCAATSGFLIIRARNRRDSAAMELGVCAAGAADGVPVQRAEGLQVGVVLAVQAVADFVEVGGVVGGGGFGVQEGAGGVAQGEQGAEFAGLGAGTSWGRSMPPVTRVNVPSVSALRWPSG